MTRRALLLCLLALAPGGVTACGGEETERPAQPAAERPASTADAARTLREAYTRTLRERTAQATYRVAATPGGVLLRAEGPSDLRRTNARLDVRIASGGGPSDAIAVHLTADGSFVELPGAGWRRAPQDASSFSTGLDALAWLGGVTDDVREVGPRRFRAVVDLGRVARELPPGERERYRAELRRRFRATELPTEVVLDEEGRVARFVVDLPASALREAPGGGVRALRIEVALARFGVAVPPAPREAAELGGTDPS